MLKSGSTIQSVTALSVGDVECYAVVKGTLYADVGIDVECQVESDRSQPRSLAERIGPGLGTQHLHTKFLWIRERVQDPG